MSQNIKYDISRPAAPTNVDVIVGGSNGYSWDVKIEFATTVSNYRWIKIVWNTTTMDADEVHNHGGTADWAFYKDSNTDIDYKRSRIIRVDGKERTLTFNAKESSDDDIEIPWNTHGYFNVITYDQTYQDKNGQVNPKNLRNYSLTSKYSSQFCSSAEYVRTDKGHLYLGYTINYYSADQLTTTLLFDGYSNHLYHVSNLNIKCYRNSNNTYVDGSGNLDSPTGSGVNFPVPQGYNTTSNRIHYNLPYNNGKETYKFSFLVQNQAGVYSGNTELDTRGTIEIEEAIKDADWKTEEAIDTNGKTKIYSIPNFRKRATIQISNINIKEETFVSKGDFITKPYISKKPLYAVQLHANEVFDFIDEIPTNPEQFIRYYLQFLDNGGWYRISPIHRRNETWLEDTEQYDNNLKIVPKIIIFDTNLSDDEQLKNILLKNTAYINFNKKVHSIRLKITLDIENIKDNFVSPKVVDYVIKAITRDILKANVLEEDIGNVR